MTRTYKDRGLQRMYDACVAAFADPASEFWSGQRQRRGATHRCAFWDGYNGVLNLHRRTRALAHAAYMAGKDCAR